MKYGVLKIRHNLSLKQIRVAELTTVEIITSFQISTTHHSICLIIENIKRYCILFKKA